MRVLVFSDYSGSKYWRFQVPFKYINRMGYDAIVCKSGITDDVLYGTDIVVLHNIVHKEGIATILAHREVNGTKLIVDVDDALWVTDNNPHKKNWEVLDATFVITETIKRADMVTCSTEYLKKELLKLNKNVVVLPNSFDPDWFGPHTENTNDEIRLGWAGGVSHKDDFIFIAPVINKIMAKYPKVKFIICGDPRLRAMMNYKSRVELMQPVPIENWGKRLASLRLDIGIAPLADNKFNRYKSNIKFLEYAMCGIPALTSNIVYKANPYTAKTHKEWFEKLSTLIGSKRERDLLAKKQYDIASKYSIVSNYHKWFDAYGQCCINVPAPIQSEPREWNKRGPRGPYKH